MFPRVPPQSDQSFSQGAEGISEYGTKPKNKKQTKKVLLMFDSNKAIDG